ncbi:MAG: nucleotidyltransferase domain-containing protein [Pseudomonadota bacterium]
MTAVSPQMRARIEGELARIETEEQATILFAIESGSRAWGFHSGDSDYDVRFVYARPVDWHLSLLPGRDVIERPLDDELDISGWDLRKALNLMLSGNAVIGEWLRSPLTYRRLPVTDDLMTLATDVLRPKPAGWHYLRLMQRQKARLIGPHGGVRLKRLFYTVRPALTLRWLRRHGRGAAPMDMPTLLAETDIPKDMHAQIDALTALKMSRPEAGELEEHPADLLAFLEGQEQAAEAWLAATPQQPVSPEHIAAAERLHRHVIHSVTSSPTPNPGTDRTRVL